MGAAGGKNSRVVHNITTYQHTAYRRQQEHPNNQNKHGRKTART